MAGLLELGSILSGLFGSGMDYLQGMGDRRTMQGRFNKAEDIYGADMAGSRTDLTNLLAQLQPRQVNLANKSTVDFDAMMKDLLGEAKTRGVEGINAAQLGQGQSAGIFQKLLGGVQDAYGGLRGQTKWDTAQAIKDLTGASDKQVWRSNQAYQGLSDQAMSMLEGLGDQAKRDTRQDYRNLESKGQQDLVSRGLGNSTLLTGMRQSNERQKQDAIGRLDESIRQQKVGTYTDIGREGLSAANTLRMQGLSGQAGLTGQSLGLLGSTGLAGAGAMTGAYGMQAGAGNEWAGKVAGARDASAQGYWDAISSLKPQGYNIGMGASSNLLAADERYGMLPIDMLRGDLTNQANLYLGAPAPLAVSSPLNGLSNSLMQMYGINAMKPDEPNWFESWGKNLIPTPTAGWSPQNSPWTLGIGL